MSANAQNVEKADGNATTDPAVHLADSLAPPLTGTSPRRPPFRSLELDGLRGIAVALVVLFHTPSIMLQYAVHSHFSATLLAVWTRVHDSGWAGVDIFFALSGFLITRNLVETRTRPNYYKNFYARRVLRIMPLYLLILVLVAITERHSLPYILLCLVYLANFGAALGQYVAYPVLWSLSVEEHFYLIWPTLIRKLDSRKALLAGASICILTPVARALATYYGLMNPLFSWFRFDGFMYGAIVALLFTSGQQNLKLLLRWAYIAGLASIAVLVIGSHWQIYTRFSFTGAVLLYSCIAALASAIIAYAIARPGSRSLSVLRNPFLRLLGDVSYWVYLIHVAFLAPLISVLLKLRASRLDLVLAHPVAIYLAQFVYLAIVCIGSGILVRKFIELPILRLKRYL